MATNPRIKVVVIGNSSVGKSSLLTVYMDDIFCMQVKATIGQDIKSKDLVINQKNLRLSIWDTCGQEKFHSLAPAYYREAKGVLLVYDVTNRESFQEIRKWMEVMDVYCTEPDVAKVLVANKTDQVEKRQVTQEEGQRLAQVLKIPYFECSAMEKRGVTAAFQHLAEVINRNDTEQEKEEDLDLTRQIGGANVVHHVHHHEVIHLHKELQPQSRCRCC